MRVVIFTCGRDAGKAALATRTVPAGWPVAWCLDAPDADLPLPKGVARIVEPFKRGVNLSGPAACFGVARVLEREARVTGRVAKLDSDTLLVDPSFLLVGELAGVAHGTGGGAAYGLAYALSSKAAGRAVEGLQSDAKRDILPCAEDVAITRAARAGGGLIPLEACWNSPHRGMPPQGTKVIHCGWTAAASREGDGVAREMQRLGDALGLWRRG
jgi:hypothetical protein